MPASVQRRVFRRRLVSLAEGTGVLVSEPTYRVASPCRCLMKLIRRVKGKCLSDHTSRCEKYFHLL